MDQSAEKKRLASIPPVAGNLARRPDPSEATGPEGETGALSRVVDQVREDAEDSPSGYLADSTVPEGGE